MLLPFTTSCRQNLKTRRCIFILCRSLRQSLRGLVWTLKYVLHYTLGISHCVICSLWGPGEPEIETQAIAQQLHQLCQFPLILSAAKSDSPILRNYAENVIKGRPSTYLQRCLSLRTVFQRSFFGAYKNIKCSLVWHQHWGRFILLTTVLMDGLGGLFVT